MNEALDKLAESVRERVSRGALSLLSCHASQADPLLPLIAQTGIGRSDRCHFRTLYPVDLAMLTTAPAARFASGGTGRIGPGMTADVVVLDGDPTLDVRAFAKVRMTMRDGRVIYRRT